MAAAETAIVPMIPVIPVQIRTQPEPIEMTQTAAPTGYLASLGVAVLAFTIPTVGALAQASVPAREITRPMEFTTGRDDNLFSLRRSQDDIHEWDLGLGELEKGEYTAAVERLHRLLQQEFGGVAPVAPGRFQGLRLAVITTLANMSPKAKEAYETLVRREAGYLLERPLHELLAEQLELLATRYPTSKAGLAARTRLGDLALEQGDGPGAIGHYRRALDATAIGSTAERRLADRLQAAGTLVDPRTARAARSNGDAGTGAPREDATSAVLDVLPASSDPTGYPALGGGGDGRTPMSEPAGNPAPRWSRAVYASGFQNRESGNYAMHAVGDLDGLFVNTGRDLHAYDPLRGEERWVSEAPLGNDEQPRRTRRHWRREAGSGINHDMVLAAAIGDEVVVAALQVPERTANVDFHNNFRILSKIARRRTFAWNRTTGALLWRHFDELDGPISRRYRGHDACGPPLVVDDTVYIPVHDRSGAIAFSIGAYDLHTGELRWRRLVCSSQQEVNMFGNARMEFAASPLAISNGVIYGASNLGVVFAIDASSGETRWVTSHDVVQMPTASLRRQRERPVYFMNNAPVVIDGVLCSTPLDSPFVLGLDAETGRLLWRVPHRAPCNGDEHDVRWLAGAIGDEFILTGRGAIAIKARSDGLLAGRTEVRQLVSPMNFRQRAGGGVAGRPAIAGDRLWLARLGQITAFDRNGDELPPTERMILRDYAGGNLVFVDGIVSSLRLGALDLFYDRTAVLASVEERYHRSPDDPAAVLRLASLRAALLPESPTAEERAEVTALYREGLEACQRRGLARSHPVRRALQRELFIQAESAAIAAVNTSAPEALELLVEARETAPDIRRWIDMQMHVLEQCATFPQRLRTELDRLERTAVGQQLLLADGPQPVRAFVLYRRAQLPGQEPASMVATWQDLLENYPGASFRGQPARDLAMTAIGRLLARHGKACYAAVATRADLALADAGDDPDALRSVSARFPNSEAARTARTRVLDRSVERGDLAIACDVLAQELSREQMDPRILRRVLVAARVRGNRGLARSVADLLAKFGDVESDWPADGGKRFADVLAALRPALIEPPQTNRLALPLHEVARIRPRTPRESFRLVDTIHADGFTPPADQPLFAVAGADLLAIDVHQAGEHKPILYSLPVQFLEHVVLCGETLIVPDLERVFAIDYRTGRTRWQLDETDGQLLDGLGVQRGVFHLNAQPSNGEGPSRCYGVEPLSGRVLFSRPLPGERMRPVPKPIGDELVVIQVDDPKQRRLLRLDPLTGRTLRTIPIPDAVPRAEGIATRIFPQSMCGDSERIYLPIDSSYSKDIPELFAIDNAGEVAWHWRGVADRRLAMAALFGDKMVIVQDGDDSHDGRIAILDAATGNPLREEPLGYDIDVLNWQRTFTRSPAPRALLVSDLESADGRDRRVYCFGLEDGIPSFVERMSAGLGEIERAPQVGDGFLTFGVRPDRGGRFRLYSIGLDNRRGALPDGQKYRSLDIDPTYALSSVGPYTVLCCAEYLVVLGPENTKR